MKPGKSKKVVLFAGQDLSQWESLEGGKAPWDLEDGVMSVAVGSGDILTRETFADAWIHVEFKLPLELKAKGNSGVYIHNRYEIQILDSYGVEKLRTGSCGAVYKTHTPIVNACKAPGEWQKYDIIFRAPRFNNNDEVIEKARVTVLLNDQIVQNNVVIVPTGTRSDKPIIASGPLLLQDHGDPVQFRNIWIQHLPQDGSDSYGPG